MWNSGRLPNISATVSPLPDAQLGEPAGERVRALAHLAPGDRDAVVAVAQRDVVGLLLGGDAERLGDGRGVDRALVRRPGWRCCLPCSSLPRDCCPRGNATAGASARARTAGGEVGSGGAALRAGALVPGVPGLANRDQRAGNQTDLPAMRVGLHGPGAASLLHDRGLHPCSCPTGLFALSARPPAPYDAGLSRFLRQKTGAKKRNFAGALGPARQAHRGTRPPAAG